MGLTPDGQADAGSAPPPPPPPVEGPAGGSAPGAPPAPAIDPAQVRLAGEQLGGVLAGGLWLLFGVASRRELSGEERAALHAACVRYAEARPWVVGAMRVTPELDLGGTLAMLLMQRFLFEGPVKPKGKDDAGDRGADGSAPADAPVPGSVVAP